MNLNIPAAIACSWDATGLVWLIGLAFTKPNVRAQSIGRRLFYGTLVVLGFFMLASRHFDAGWLGRELYPSWPPIEITGLVLTVTGCVYAIWARVVLGANWSGRPTVKEGHELIIRGPYSVTRHPIYSGLLLASAGTAMATCEVRCVLGLTLIGTAFLIKMAQEEQLMMQIFPEAYPAYRGRVKALIPGVF